MAKSLQERTAELRNRGFSRPGIPNLVPETPSTIPTFSGTVRRIVNEDQVYKKIESKILQLENASSIKDLKPDQLAKYGVRTAFLQPRRNELRLAFLNDEMRSTYREMLDQGVVPTRIANAVVAQRLNRKVEDIVEQPKNTSVANKPATISSPETKLGRVGAAQLAQRQDSAKLRDTLRQKFPFGKFLFGKDEAGWRGLDEPIQGEGLIENFIVNPIKQRGAIRALWGNTLKDSVEKELDYQAEFKKFGYTEEEAARKANAYLFQNKKGLSQAEQDLIDSVEYRRKAWSVVEFLDIIPAFRLARQTLSKTVVRDVMQSAIQAPNASEARKILIESIPQLKGTQQADDIVSFLQEVKDPVKGDVALKQMIDAGTAPKSQFDTTAQQVFYDRGIPVVRGAQTPVGRSVAEDIVNVRDEITRVLAGQAEEARLSNLDVLRSEIKAGSLPFKQTTEEAVTVFSTRNVNRLRVGQQVTLEKQLAESIAETASDVKQMAAKPDDLVRLSDGTFVYAPKVQLGKGLTPSIKSVSKQQRDKVAKLEADRKAQAERARKADEERVRAEQKAVADASRKARIDREAAKRQAQEQLATVARNTDTEIAKLRVKVNEETKALTRQVQDANKAVRSASTKVETLKKKIAEAKTPARKKELGEKLKEARMELEGANRAMPDKVAIEARKAELRRELSEGVKAIKAEAGRVTKEAKEVLGETKKPAKKVDATVSETVKILKPSKGGNVPEPLSGGATVASKFATRIKQEAEEMLARVEGDIGVIPEHHAVATNEAQMKKAFEYVAENPEQAYADFIAGKKGDIAEAAIYNVLTKSDFLKDDPVRMENVIRTFFKSGTRLAQEFQARKLVGNLDYATIVGRLTRLSEEVAKRKGVNIQAETDKLVKELGGKLDEITPNTKKSVTSAIDEITCQ